eukprot:m.178652 g.178652  ORF g.178652 m.178652 type:complete len:637 (+) comp17984_c1_seq3:3083-4993(+)
MVLTLCDAWLFQDHNNNDCNNHHDNHDDDKHDQYDDENDHHHHHDEHNVHNVNKHDFYNNDHDQHVNKHHHNNYIHHHVYHHDDHDDHGEEEHSDHDEEEHSEEEHDDHSEEGGCYPVARLFSELLNGTNGTNGTADEEQFEEIGLSILAGLATGNCNKPVPNDPERFVNRLFEEFASGQALDQEGLENLFSAVGLSGEVEDAHAGHGHRRRRSIQLPSRRRRAIPAQCYTVPELLAIFGMVPPLTASEFTTISVGIVDMIESGACSATTASSSSASDSEKWGYGVLAVTIVCLTSAAAVLILPCVGSKPVLAAGAGPNHTGTVLQNPAYEAGPLVSSVDPARKPSDPGYLAVGSDAPAKFDDVEAGHGGAANDWAHFQLSKHALSFMLALAVGSLFGDSALHLLPYIFGAHVDEPGEDHSDHDEDFDWLWKGLGAVGGLYIFYLIEVLLGAVVKANRDSKQAGVEMSHTHSHPAPSTNAALPSLVIVGDALHNFVDGLAIGAAFSVSSTAGVSLTIAVFCHELPHEIGDFGVLLECGYSVYRALFWNVVSSLTSYVGLFIALSTSTGDSRAWILAFTTGMFLYIALTDLLPELLTILAHCKKEEFWTHFRLQQMGLWFSFAIMILLARYEAEIQV